MDEVDREQIKLLANALDRASTAFLTIGVLAPLSALYFQIPLSRAAAIEAVHIGIICDLGGAWALHLAAQRTLRGLNP
jgi:hypothetical protein